MTGTNASCAYGTCRDLNTSVQLHLTQSSIMEGLERGGSYEMVVSVVSRGDKRVAASCVRSCTLLCNGR